MQEEEWSRPGTSGVLPTHGDDCTLRIAILSLLIYVILTIHGESETSPKLIDDDQDLSSSWRRESIQADIRNDASIGPCLCT